MTQRLKLKILNNLKIKFIVYTKATFDLRHICRHIEKERWRKSRGDSESFKEFLGR